MSYYSDQVIRDGAVAYWRLNETSGTTAVDVIGGNNGTISGGVSLNQPGALADGDKAMLFDGATSYIQAPHSASLNVPTAVTLEAWIKIANWSASYVSIIMKGTAGTQFSYGLNLHNSARPTYQANGGSFITSATGLFALNTW